MTTFTVYFRSDADSASEDFEADTPDQALALARARYADDPLNFWFEPYGGMHVNEIAVCNADGDEVAAWLDDELRLRLAAGDLLTALQLALRALNTARRFRVGDTDSYAIASLCGDAIAKATGQAR